MKDFDKVRLKISGLNKQIGLNGNNKGGGVISLISRLEHDS